MSAESGFASGRFEYVNQMRSKVSTQAIISKAKRGTCHLSSRVNSSLKFSTDE